MQNNSNNSGKNYIRAAAAVGIFLAGMATQYFSSKDNYHILQNQTLKQVSLVYEGMWSGCSQDVITIDSNMYDCNAAKKTAVTRNTSPAKKTSPTTKAGQLEETVEQLAPPSNQTSIDCQQSGYVGKVKK